MIDSVKMRCGYRAGVPVQQPYTKYEPDNDEVYIHAHSHSTTHTHTHTSLTALCQELPGRAGTRKVKPIWILLKQETVSGSGISWAVCKCETRSKQIATPAPHHSVFFTAECPSCHPTNSVKALEAITCTVQEYFYLNFDYLKLYQVAGPTKATVHPVKKVGPCSNRHVALWQKPQCGITYCQQLPTDQAGVGCSDC